MAKFNKSFSTKGSLDLSTGIVTELKKSGGEEYFEEVDLFGYLKEFDGKNVSISIKEDKEVYTVEDSKEENDIKDKEG